MTTIRCRKSAAYLCSCIAFSSSTALSQTTVCRHDWTIYASPATAISAQIHAEADFIRSAGAASRDVAIAREIHARAAGLETTNSVAYARAFWDRRAIWESERDQQRVSEAARLTLASDRTWEQLKDHPELSRHQITNGNALNFLLARLASRFSAGSKVALDRKSAGMPEYLMLRGELLPALRLRQPTVGSQGLVFRASDGSPFDVGLWPSALRIPELARQRDAFEHARKDLLDSGDSLADRDTALARLQSSYRALANAFDDYHTHDRRHQSAHSYRHYVVARQFLKCISTQLVSLREVNPMRTNADALRFGGESIVDLVEHMAHRGLLFAPAAPGDERAYFEVFYKLRDLYLVTQDSASSVPSKPDTDAVAKADVQ